MQFPFINFDGRVNGETARRLAVAADLRNMTPQALIQEILRTSLGEILNVSTAEQDTEVKPWTANEGCGGFHVVTVVADGYGSIVAENQNGEERARVACQDPDEADANPGQDLVNLMTEFTRVVEAERNG